MIEASRTSRTTRRSVGFWVYSEGLGLRVIRVFPACCEDELALVEVLEVVAGPAGPPVEVASEIPD